MTNLTMQIQFKELNYRGRSGFGKVSREREWWRKERACRETVWKNIWTWIRL